MGKLYKTPGIQPTAYTAPIAPARPKTKAIPKKIRQQVYDKYNGHCAYCGREIAYAEMQVDHLVPILRGFTDKEIQEGGWTRGEDNPSNYMPSCRMCNFRKGTYDLEEFRKEITKQADSLCATFQGRMSIIYGLVKHIEKPIVFYFEQYKKSTSNTEKT